MMIHNTHDLFEILKMYKEKLQRLKKQACRLLISTAANDILCWLSFLSCQSGLKHQLSNIKMGCI